MSDKSTIQLDVTMALLDAVSYLNKKMCVIRDAAKIKGTDKIAVMAALSLTTELLATKSPEGPFSGLTMAEVKQKIQGMHESIEQALTPQENLF